MIFILPSCFQASKKYIEAVAAGVSTAEATKASRNTFAKQISSLTSQVSVYSASQML